MLLLLCRESTVEHELGDPSSRASAIELRTGKHDISREIFLENPALLVHCFKGGAFARILHGGHKIKTRGRNECHIYTDAAEGFLLAIFHPVSPIRVMMWLFIPMSSTAPFRFCVKTMQANNPQAGDWLDPHCFREAHHRRRVQQCNVAAAVAPRRTFTVKCLRGGGGCGTRRFCCCQR